MNAVTSVPAITNVIAGIKSDFPILAQQVNGHDLVYLDNAASTQKPNLVIDGIAEYYRSDHSNVHRGAHTLSERATSKFEQARTTVANFIGAATEEVLWTRGTTESINLVAMTWGRVNLKSGDRILVSTLEHHSNIVPWQLLADLVGAEVVAVPIDSAGDIDLEAYQSLLDERVKLVSVNHVSNALGTVNPVEKIISMAKTVGAKVLIDGAQSVAHFPVDVQQLGCDFYAFSGHKVFGPTGIGVLWGRKDLLLEMPPYQGGGEMIETVSFSGTRFAGLPFKFEAGTPNIAGAIGLSKALEYLQTFDKAELEKHEANLLSHCISMGEEFGLQRVGCPKRAAGVYSFLMEGAHPSDIGMLLDQQGVAIRTGHHCAQPLMAELAIPGTARASFSIYNTLEDVDALFTALEKIKHFF